jgi:hypothetical protein
VAGTKYGSNVAAMQNADLNLFFHVQFQLALPPARIAIILRGAGSAPGRCQR